MSEKAPEQKETPGSSDHDERQKKDKGRELFTKMAKVKNYPIDHRPPEPDEEQ